MIGLGRAIGETMIVLMATGNTAIMDWSIFNGMRPAVVEYCRGNPRSALWQHPLPGSVSFGGLALCHDFYS
jgi:hypothetical protein